MRANSNRLSFLLLPLLMLALACGGSGGGSDDDLELEGTWAGPCVPAGMDFVRTHIAFEAGEIAVRTIRYDDADCIIEEQVGERSDGLFVELPRARGDEATPIDTEITALNSAAHTALFPRTFDIYVIQGKRLSYGDYTTGSGATAGARPLLAGNQRLIRIGRNTAAIF